MTDAPRPARTTFGDRVRDTVALVGVVVGVVLVLVSHGGMRRLATQPILVRRGEFAIVQFERYRSIELWGYGVTGLGVAFGIASYVVHARRKSGPPVPPALPPASPLGD